MILVSDRWKEYSKTNSGFIPSGTLTNDGETLNLTQEDFMMGGVSFTDDIADTNEFPIGTVITNSVTLRLNNFDGKFETFNFNKAIFTLYYTVDFGDDTETIQRGVYTIEKPRTMGYVIEVTGYDYMDKLNKTYPSTVIQSVNPFQLAKTICSYCGVSENIPTLIVPNISKTRLDSTTTCRQILAWILQMYGWYAKVDPTGVLQVHEIPPSGWADPTVEGGTINPWSGADSFNGGTINPWNTDADEDWGGFVPPETYEIEKIKSLSVSFEELSVTGVRVYAFNNDSNPAMEGYSGYVVNISGNPFITDSNKADVADQVWSAYQNIQISAFDATTFGDPSVEAGDEVIMMDYNGNACYSVVMGMSYTEGDMTLRTDIEPLVESERDFVNTTTQTIQNAVNATTDELETNGLTSLIVGTLKLGSNATEVKDFVTDQGTSGGWSYRKWSSGIKECWMQVSDSSVPLTTQEGSFYYGETSVNFPSGLFTDKPIIQASVRNSNVPLPMSVKTASASGVTLYVVAGQSTTRSFHYDVYAIGN